MTTKLITLEGLVGSDFYKKAGLAKLTEEEQRLLAEWIDRAMNNLAKSVERDCRRGLMK